MRLGRTVLATVVVLLGVSIAAAQSGGLTVKVYGQSGPLEGATVTISQDTGFVKTTSLATDRHGVVEFPVLRVGGGYTIEVAAKGFATRHIAGLTVKIGDEQHMTVRLAEQVEEYVRVSTEAPVVDLEKPSTSTKFTDDFIQDLPVLGRFYQNILTLAPGVQDADGDGNPNVHGARNRDFKAIVSGISNVDPLTGQQAMQINPNSIEEMEVITAGAGVEFSRAQGGFARIVQKQGSNDFEGLVEFYFRSSRLDGTGASDFSALPEPSFQWIQPAFQISGPIIRDRVWYRFSHEFFNVEVPINTTTEIIVQTQKLGVHADQITWQVSPRNKLAFQFQSDPLDIDNFGVTNLVPAESSQRLKNEGQTWSLVWTAPYSPRLLVESRLAWQDLSLGLFPAVPGTPNNCIRGDGVLEFLEQSQCFDAESDLTSGSHFLTLDDHSQRLTVGGDATIHGGRFWGATHRFKVGMSVENERYFRFQERRPNMQVFPYSLASEGPGGGVTVQRRAFIPVTLAVPQSDQVRATGISWGAYVEDQIKPLQNLTVTLGLRIDREEINAEGHQPIDFESESLEFQRLTGPTVGLAAPTAWPLAFTAYEDIVPLASALAGVLEEDPTTFITRLSHSAQVSQNWPNQRRRDDQYLTNTNISPFLAVSWDPWSNGKTKFSATARRYHAKTFLAIPLIELEPATTTVVYDALRNPDGTWHVEGFEPGINPAVNVSTVDRDLRTPYNDEWTLTFERELWAETSIAVIYVNRKFRDQYQDIDTNNLPGDYGRCIRATAASPRTLDPVPENDPDYHPGGGDGTLDDCAGKIDSIGGTLGEGDPDLAERVERPDGILDLYLQNPAWGEVFLVGNFNQIDYESFVTQLTRRQYRSWEMQASYTWSRATGNGEDFQQSLGRDRTLLEDEFGPQSYDQRHVVKVNATTITPWGFRLGGAVSWESGLPYSLIADQLSFHQNIPSYGQLSSATAPRRRQIYTGGRRNSERNESFWNVNAKFSKEMNLGRGLNMQFSVEVFNLLNDGTYIIFNPATESGRQINGTNEATRRFGRQWQLGLKMAF